MAKRNRAYWQERFAAQEAYLLEEGQAYYEYMERQYNQAARSLQDNIDRWYRRFADNNEISFSEAKKRLTAGQMEELRWTVEEYIQHGQENAVDGRWLRELENASARVHVTRLEALQLEMRQQVEILFGNQLDSMDRTMRIILTEGYTHTAFELQKGVGVGWSFPALDPKRVELLLRGPWSPGGENFSQKLWGNRERLLGNLETHFTQALIRGDSPDKVITAVAEDMRRSRNAAGRLVMTESAYFAAAGQKQCFRELGVEEYEIVATLDNETSDICKALDGQVFSMTDYQPGVTAPPFHPWCRSCTAPYFADDPGERVARDSDGKTYMVPGDMTYGEWKKQQERDILEAEKPIFVPATSIKEAEAFAREQLGIPNVSYKGCDLVTANAWNEGLQDTFRRFPELKSRFGFVGEAHERNALIKPVVREHSLQQLKRMNPGVPESTLIPYVDKEIASFMRSLSVSKNTYAQSFRHSHPALEPFQGISVNRDWGKSSERFLEALGRDVAAGFHPVGCDTIRSILDHEIGHQLDNWLNVGSQKNIQSLYNRRTNKKLSEDLSRYAWDHGSGDKYAEMIAEGWAEYCNNPVPRPVAEEIGTTIERLYAEWIKKNS